MDVLPELARLITREREELLTTWRAQVCQLPSAQSLDIPTLNDHVPDLLDELATAFLSHSEVSIVDIVTEGTPPAHGMQRVKDGYDIEEVVAEYNILRDCIHRLADRHQLSMQGEPFRILNRVLDGAIGAAVASYATQKAVEVQHRREEYLAFVAHDLRTPLSAISLTSLVIEQLLERDQSGTPETTLRFKTLNRNVRHLQELVSQVLTDNMNHETESGIKLQRRRFDLWPLVEALIHDLHPIAGTDSTRLINEVPDSLVVYADANLLKRVFQNLIGNAISYTPRGEVVIGASMSDDGRTADCFVRDNGEGMTEARRLTLFDARETDASKPGGMGLGLAIVKTFIEAHGGDVHVESVGGFGTTFHFSLPGQME